MRGDRLPPQDEVRERLRDQGDSLIVIRSGDVLKVHVHTDEPERVFAYLRGLGSLVTHKAEDMQAQHATVERAADRHVRLARRAVTVFTDSASDLPEEIVRAHGIHVTPLLLVDDDRTLRDGRGHLRPGVPRPPGRTTRRSPPPASPRPADFLETYARAAEDGEDAGRRDPRLVPVGDACQRRRRGRPVRGRAGAPGGLCRGVAPPGPDGAQGLRTGRARHGARGDRPGAGRGSGANRASSSPWTPSTACSLRAGSGAGVPSSAPCSRVKPILAADHRRAGSSRWARRWGGAARRRRS